MKARGPGQDAVPAGDMHIDAIVPALDEESAIGAVVREVPRPPAGWPLAVIGIGWLGGLAIDAARVRWTV